MAMSISDVMSELMVENLRSNSVTAKQERDMLNTMTAQVRNQAAEATTNTLKAIQDARSVSQDVEYVKGLSAVQNWLTQGLEYK